jgi:hypothetical protein
VCGYVIRRNLEDISVVFGIFVALMWWYLHVVEVPFSIAGRKCNGRLRF